MYKLVKLSGPRARPFIVYAAALAAILAAGVFYQEVIIRRPLTRVTASVRRAFVDQTELSRLKLEQSALAFEWANLAGKFPQLTNLARQREWRAASVFADLDPDVRRKRAAYRQHVSPLVRKADPTLGPFMALRDAFESDVDRLAVDWARKDKGAALMNLRTNKFASLFQNPVYAQDGARLDTAAGKLRDKKTLRLRAEYEQAVLSAVINRTPALADYGRARVQKEKRAAEIKGRLAQLDGQMTAPGTRVADQARDLRRSLGAFDRFWTRKSLSSYVPRKSDFLIIGLATAAIGVVLTWPAELRAGRWGKIGASVGLTCLGLLALQVPLSSTVGERHENIFAFMGYVMTAVVVAALWTPNLCTLFAGGLVHLIDSPDSRPVDTGGLTPAYRAARQNNFREALRLTGQKPLPDHRRYEGLVLKAKLHRHLDHRWRTKWILRRLLKNRDLNDTQRSHIEGMLRELPDKSKACWKL